MSMTASDVLSMLKMNLSILDTSKDTYLAQLINVAKIQIEREGASLDCEVDSDGNIVSVGNIDDANLLVMYAAYLFRKRAQDDAVMPRMLRYALNNKVFSQKMEADT